MSRRILIVDDQPFMRHMLRKILEETGYEIVGEAGDGEEAIQQYKALKPDLVTLDMVMPKMDGIAALKAIREHDPKARCIVVSAISQKEKLLEVMQAGAMDYVVKPFDAKQVSAALSRVLG